MPQDLETGSTPGSNYFLYWRQLTGAKAARVSLVSCIATFDKTGLLQLNCTKLACQGFEGRSRGKQI